MADSGRQKAKPAKSKARFFDPPNILRQKVGVGGFDPAAIDKADKFIDEHHLDFEPYARELLKKLERAIAQAKKTPKADKPVINKVCEPIMELKANGSMFHYALVSEIAAVILNFLENLDELNEDSFNIIDVHQRTLTAIVTSRLSGSGGREGRALAEELYQACQRYKKKYSVVLDM